MNSLETIIIAIVEGLTEFLPVSSTGHMILTQALLGVESSDFVKMFTVNIQFGAILSVVILYWKRFFNINKVENQQFADQKGICKLWNKFAYKFDFYVKLLIAVLPAAVLGFLFSDKIDALL
ncbi:MAG: undecaprenyl-diphosphate phosphatase, partial [Paludibacter sp.]|nr:undecaprenyl-diphosphate phosphatase [Paludibacter sp.]